MRLDSLKHLARSVQAMMEAEILRERIDKINMSADKVAGCHVFLEDILEMIRGK